MRWTRRLVVPVLLDNLDAWLPQISYYFLKFLRPVSSQFTKAGTSSL